MAPLVGIFVLTTLLLSLARAYTVNSPADYSAACNATLAAFGTDPAVSECAKVENYYSAASVMFQQNTSQLANFLPPVCSETSICTSSVVARVAQSINGDCANETKNSDPSGPLNVYFRSLIFAGVYQQSLCATDNQTGYCIADFLPTFLKWPSSYSITVGIELGLFSAAAGNLGPTLANQSAFNLCTTCSTKEYNYVFAFIENILLGSSTLSTTQVGLPGPGPIGTDAQQTLSYISTMNITISNICGAPFLTFPVAVPPPAANGTAPNATSQTTGTVAANSGSTPTSSSSTKTTTHSAAAGIRSSIPSAIVLSGMAILVALAFQAW